MLLFSEFLFIYVDDSEPLEECFCLFANFLFDFVFISNDGLWNLSRVRVDVYDRRNSHTFLQSDAFE